MSESNDMPFLQRVLENNWLLLVLAVMTPMVIYTAWGLLDVLAIPPAP